MVDLRRPFRAASMRSDAKQGIPIIEAQARDRKHELAQRRSRSESIPHDPDRPCIDHHATARASTPARTQ
jgi:hypothetical protein